MFLLLNSIACSNNTDYIPKFRDAPAGGLEKVVKEAVDKGYFKASLTPQEATKFLTDADHRQTVNNVKATKLKLGLLINFGTPSLTYKRVIN